MQTKKLKIGFIRNLNLVILTCIQNASMEKKPLPQKISYGFNRTKDYLAKIVESYETQRLALVNKYGSKKPRSEDFNEETNKEELLLDDQSNAIFTDENKELFNKDLEELLNMEDEAAVFELKLSEFEKMDDITRHIVLQSDWMEYLSVMIIE